MANKRVIAGWIVCALVGVFLIGVSATPKFLDLEDLQTMFDKFGLTKAQMRQIGVLEILLTIAFLIPQTSFLGAILLTGYLGGAVLTHFRVGDLNVFPVLVGVVMWIGLALRKPVICQLALGQTPDLPPSEGSPAGKSNVPGA